MDLIKSLKKLGLNEKEANIYIACLQLEKDTAYNISKYSGIKKPTTDVILEELVDKGVAIKIPGKKTTHYSVISPGELFAKAKDDLTSAEKVLPELEAINRSKVKKKVGISYYEGLDGIKEMYKKIQSSMKNKEYIGFFAHYKNNIKKLEELMDEVDEKNRKLGISRKAITVDDASLAKFFSKEYIKKYRTEIKTLPISKYDSSISMEIYKNSVNIISFRYLQGIVIENPDMAKVLKQIFKIVWDQANPLEFKK